MFGISVLICAFLPALVLSDPTRPLEKRQSCPVACSSCCDALPPAGCYAPVSGPGAGVYACYDYPPGEVVSTQYASGAYSSDYYYPSSEPYGSYYSSEAYPSYSSAYYSSPYYSSPSYSSPYYSSPTYSSSYNFGSGPTPTRYRPEQSSATPSSSAGVVPGTGAADNNNVAFSCFMVVGGVVGLAVLL